MLALITLAFAAVPIQEPMQPLAFVEIEPAEGERWAGEVEEIIIRFGIETELADARLISVFRRPLDLPVRLDTQAWNENSYVLMIPQRGELGDGPSFAWDGDLAYAQGSVEERAGTRFRVYTVRARVEFASGVSHGSLNQNLEFDPARLHLSYATEYETDFLGERVPVSEERLVVKSAPFFRELKELPIGSLRSMQSSGLLRETKLTATVTPSEVDAGDEFQLEVLVEGELLPSSVDLIHPAELGWKLLGELQVEEGAKQQRYRFDGRAEQAGTIEFLPFRLVRFDPDAGEYRQDLSEQLTLRVRGSAAQASVESTPTEPMPSQLPLETTATAKQSLPVWVHWLLGAGLLALAAWGRQVMRQSAHRRETGAVAGADHDSDRRDREPLEAWLAAQLGWKPAQLVDLALRARLLAVGVPQELATATADFLQAAEAARYGGPLASDVEQVREELRRKWTAHAKTQAQ
jgi:hypothetical protein